MNFIERDTRMTEITPTTMPPPGSRIEGTKEQLESLARSFYEMKDLLDLVEGLKAQRDNFERVAIAATKENEVLRHQGRQWRGERDHYFRAYSSLSGQLEGLGAALITAIKMSRVQGYEPGARPRAEPEDSAAPVKDPTKQPIPAFLRQGPAIGSPISEQALEEALRPLIENRG